MPWIFSYGELTEKRLQTSFKFTPLIALPATLDNYQVVFRGKSRKWGGALASVDKKRKSVVYGTALLVPMDDVKYYDKYYQKYEKDVVTIYIDATEDKAKAFIYKIPSIVPYGVPGEDYLKEIKKQLQDFWKQPLELKQCGIHVTPPKGQIQHEREVIESAIDNVKTNQEEYEEFLRKIEEENKQKEVEAKKKTTKKKRKRGRPRKNEVK